MKNSCNFVIDVKGITRSFDKKIVVNNLDLKVKKGEVYGFLGPNGSGKTTFLRMLCGLLTPDSGSGTCLGYDILREQEKIKNEIGYMTQKFSLYQDLTVNENLDFISRIYRITNRKERIKRIINRMGLEEYKNQLVKTLSGGWKQKLALAASLIHEPNLLLLDEPTAGVDPGSRRDFWEEIHQLAGQGITVLVTTHYMDEAERCHRLAYLAYGNLLTSGTGHEVVQHANLTTWAVSGDNLYELSVKLKEMKGVEQIVVFGNVLHISGKDSALIEGHVQNLVKDNYKCERVISNLEDVFIYLTDKTGMARGS